MFPGMAFYPFSGIMETWNLLGHPLHAMLAGFPLAYAALALLMFLFLPRVGPVARWAGRWTLAAALVAVVTGIAAVGGLGEVWGAMAEDSSLGRHAWVAGATLAVMTIAVLMGHRPRHPHELARGEAVMLALSFSLVTATAWLGWEHSLYADAKEAVAASAALGAPGVEAGPRDSMDMG